MKLEIRHETPQEYRAVEELTRDAFWGNMSQPTCDGEHLLVHKLRELPIFVPALDFVAAVDGTLVGHIIYSLAKIVTPDGQAFEVLTFGPLSVLPAYKRQGVGSALMRHSIEEAKRLGYRAILFYGHPDYYPRFGFRRAREYGITNPSGRSFDALMAMELYDGALDGITGKFYEDAVFDIDPQEVAAFDKTFPPKAPAELIPIATLLARLSVDLRGVFDKKGVKYVTELQRFSGAAMLTWDGIDETVLKEINGVLTELGQPKKCLPSDSR